MRARALEGRTALVTGGGTGVGRGCARRLLEHGATVTIAARRLDVLEAAAEQFCEEVIGAQVRVQRCDVTVEEEVAAAVRRAADATGHLDVAVANAGSGVPGPILALGAEQWRAASDLNILGTALTIKQAALAMRERGGSIVAISSAGGFLVPRHLASYGVSKAGLEMLVRCAALELAPLGIRVNAIRPGYVPTEGTALAFTDEEARRIVAATPLGRPGRAEEIGDAVVYFSADSGAWVTGQILGVDGGMTIPAGADFEGLCRRLLGDDVVDGCGARPRGRPTS